MTNNLFNTGIRPAVDDWLLTKSREVRSYGDYWSASSAGYCMRKNIFERLGVPKVETEADARKQRVFTSGHLFHSWIQGITKESGLSIAQELELQDEGLMVRGHIDDLVLVENIVEVYEEPGDGTAGQVVEAIDKHLILYDYKTAHSKSFTYKKDSGDMSYFHRMQLGTYMYMLKKLHIQKKPFGVRKRAKLGEHELELTESRILLISKDDLRLHEQQLLWSDELSSEVRDYWTELNDWWSKKKMPPCTCADHEGGFMASEKWNPYFYNGEPCSLEYYQEWKKSHEVV